MNVATARIGRWPEVNLPTPWPNALGHGLFVPALTFCIGLWLVIAFTFTLALTLLLVQLCGLLVLKPLLVHARLGTVKTAFGIGQELRVRV